MRAVVLFAMAALAATPALAGEVQFAGRTLDVADQESEAILKMTSSQYALFKSQDRILNDAHTCLSGKPGITVDAVNTDAVEDDAVGHLNASVTVDYRVRFTDYVVRSKLALQAEDNRFQLVETQLEISQVDNDSAQIFVPLARQSSGWEKGLNFIIQAEEKLVDCLYK